MSELVSRRVTIKNDFLRMTPEIQTQLQELEMRSLKIDSMKNLTRLASFMLIGVSLVLMSLGWYIAPNDSIKSIDIPTEVDRNFSYSAGERLVKAVREYTFTSEGIKQREESLKIFEGELRNHQLTDLGVSYLVSQMLQGRGQDHPLSDYERTTLKEKMGILKDAVGSKNEITLSSNVMLILENRFYGHPVSPLAIEYEKSTGTKAFACKIIEYILCALGVIGFISSLGLSIIIRLINSRLNRIKPLYEGKKAVN